MKARILFFGATADVVGKREIEISLGEAATANEAFKQLLSDYPQLAKHKLLYSLNQDYVQGGEIVGDGDELAVFTAVSGG